MYTAQLGILAADICCLSFARHDSHMIHIAYLLIEAFLGL